MHKILGKRKQDEQEKVDHNFLNHTINIIIRCTVSAAAPAAPVPQPAIGLQQQQINGNLAPLTTHQFTLQFIETSYYLKDVAFLNKVSGWATGAPRNWRE